MKLVMGGCGAPWLQQQSVLEERFCAVSCPWCTASPRSADRAASTHETHPKQGFPMPPGGISQSVKAKTGYVVTWHSQQSPQPFPVLTKS